MFVIINTSQYNPAVILVVQKPLVWVLFILSSCHLLFQHLEIVNKFTAAKNILNMISNNSLYKQNDISQLLYF